MKFTFNDHVLMYETDCYVRCSCNQCTRQQYGYISTAYLSTGVSVRTAHTEYRVIEFKWLVSPLLLLLLLLLCNAAYYLNCLCVSTIQHGNVISVWGCGEIQFRLVLSIMHEYESNFVLCNAMTLYLLGHCNRLHSNRPVWCHRLKCLQECGVWSLRLGFVMLAIVCWSMVFSVYSFWDFHVKFDRWLFWLHN